MTVQKQKGISGKGDGKWETLSSLAKYRKRRNKKNAAQKAARKRNRQS